MRSATDLEDLRRFASNHRALMERSERAGCYQCGAIFAPSEIREWLHDPAAPGDPAPAEGTETGTCPRCGFATLLPSAAVPIDAGLLEEMATHHFRRR